jgi:hypothetical protein
LKPQQFAGGGVEHARLDVGLEGAARHLADDAATLAGVADRMLARHLGEAVRVVLQGRHHFLRLAFGIEHDVAHFDAVEPR